MWKKDRKIKSQRKVRKENPLLSDLAKDLKIVKSQKFLPLIAHAHFNVYFAFTIETALKDVHTNPIIVLKMKWLLHLARRK